MQDIASLGIKVESDGVVTADTRLKNLSKTAGVTDRATSGLQSTLKALAAAFSVYAIIDRTTAALSKGIAEVERYNMAVGKTAALITSMQGAQAGVELGEQYRIAKEYASALVKELEVIDAKTIAGAKDLSVITQEMLKQGLVLDINNAKQVEGFISLANAATVFSNGMEVQLRQEVRALLQGKVDATSQLASQLDAVLNGQLKEMVVLWRQQGTLVENIGDLLQGYKPFSDEMENSWDATKSTMETIVNKILREGFGPAMKDIVGMARDLVEYLKGHGAEIAGNIKAAWSALKPVMDAAIASGKFLLENIDKITTAAVSLAKIAAAGGALYALPTVFLAAQKAIGAVQMTMALASLEMAHGATVAQLLNTSLFGTSVAATAAAGAMGKLKIATGVLFAAFTGWEIGKWLSDNFEWARLAGVAFVDVTMLGVIELESAAKKAWAGIGNAWDTIIGTMKDAFAGFLSLVGEGLNKVPGAGGAADAVMAYASSIEGAGASNEKYKKTLEDIAAELEKNRTAHNEAIDGMIADAMRLEKTTVTAAKAVKVEAPVIAASSAATEKIIDIRKKFADDYAKITLSTEKYEIRSLAKRVAEYKAAGISEIQLEEWKQKELQDIQLRAMNEKLALYEELADGNLYYAYQAIEIMSTILDAEEEKWATILDSDIDAHALRLKKEQEYADKVMGIIDEVADAQISATGRVNDSATASSPARNPNVGEYTGLPVGQASSWTVYTYGGQSFNSQQEAEAFRDRERESARELVQQAADAAIAMEEAALSATELAEAAAEAATALKNTNIGKMIELFELQGRTAEALNATRWLEMQGMDESTKVLQRRIYALQDEKTASEAAAEAYAIYLSSRAIMTKVRQLDGTDYDNKRTNLTFEYVGLTNQPGISGSEQYEIMAALGRELKKLADQHAETVSDMLTPYRQLNAGMTDYEIKLAGIVEATDDAVRAGRELGLSETELNEIRSAGVILTQKAVDAEAAAIAAIAKALADTNTGKMIQILELEGKSAEALALSRKVELSTMDKSTQMLQRRIYALQDEATKLSEVEEAHNALLDKLQSAYDREAGIFQSTIDQFDDFSDSLKSFRDGLKAGNLSTLSPEEKYLSAQAAFTDISTRAQLGDVEAIAQLESSATTLLEASQGYNASGAAYVADFDAVTAALDATVGLSDRQSDIAQQQLDALTSSVDGLLKINAAVETVADILRAIHAGEAAIDKYSPTTKPAIDKYSPIPKYAAGGYHSGGLRLVGEQGPELEYTGPSRIINANDTRSMLSGGDAETKALLQQILVELRADKTQRGAVGQTTINRLEQVADKLDAQRRVLDRKVA